MKSPWIDNAPQKDSFGFTTVSITLDYREDAIHGIASISKWAIEMLESGNYIIAPLYELNDNGEVRILSLSIIRRELLDMDNVVDRHRKFQEDVE